MKVDGKVALITGGASGMGKGFAETLVAAGAKVCVVDFNSQCGEATVNELNTKHGDGKAIFCKCDVTSQTEFEEAFKRTKEVFGGIDIVVNNAGIGGESDDKWERVVDVNMKGTIRGTRLGMHDLSKDNGGNGGIIVNMASAGGINPNPFSPTYGCTKAGIVHATRCYAISEEAVKSGIRLMVLCPAFVDTPMLQNLSSGDGTQVIGGDMAKVNAFIEHIGVMSVEEVSAVFMEMIEDDSKNGLILRCAKKTGNQYCTLAVENV
ncbi:15-hydroxyprostaglandin dehydrogenase [NAD(+)]-like isoform X1 [Mercenaria mercenaria]|uniref:15-hydroxyprostaglandin dehydrogenase [NAD(+)]-like isoform X1 n=1 Tax=Mercenaria mercenaria TaxID=6596 RepID=UPI00234ED995|nr:15-hydroxyprostaglandin dehydrogenase [NAD(+)]-like isoform X1 [Mercenaria mercenaria]XP_053401490.1 15-hydroxyprostaglandin dehydrogenase [NAD(+)]-like isoform X1 [Mercenaria mercenaria]XP_053401491.1 15-hydroxyprostaglandin dehydrogenase [NAD(+)]-like isoform X1 [Mercenaria mercenaria]XP_053401492.1 15-hydroxyprostaglandin dehydrogenase [NAD(+)]-like isoform X1 [Mercenaria mercenaria]XP_053401493.1 15-hydroxyprostaglandin dehydrogenase [NAD(+)]-like isoform X1 [Mercenaria mercenaria]XP_05